MNKLEEYKKLKVAYYQGVCNFRRENLLTEEEAQILISKSPLTIEWLRNLGKLKAEAIMETTTIQ